MTTLGLESIIEVSGISSIEAKIYIAALQLRQPTLTAIAREVGMNRTSLYPYIYELKDKGLLAEANVQKKKLYIPSKPEVISRLLKDKLAEINHSLPLLNQYFHTYRNRPNVRLLEGEAGIREVYEDVLKENQEIVMFSMVDLYFERVGKIHQDFLKRRIKTGIPVRALIHKTKKALERQQTGKEQLRTIRFLPRQFGMQMNSATWIYGNKVAYFTFQEQPVSVILENEDIARSQKALFEFAWSMAKER